MVNRTLKVGIVTGILGALIQLSKIANNFPAPFNLVGNIIIFIAVFIIAFDIVLYYLHPRKEKP